MVNLGLMTGVILRQTRFNFHQKSSLNLQSNPVVTNFSTEEQLDTERGLMNIEKA